MIPCLGRSFTSVAEEGGNDSKYKCVCCIVWIHIVAFNMGKRKGRPQEMTKGIIAIMHPREIHVSDTCIKQLAAVMPGGPTICRVPAILIFF